MASRTINPLVVDLSHHNLITDLQAAKDFGIRGIIYKATEGRTYVDKTYAKVRKEAEALGFLWGAYHFFRPGDIREQVLHFIKHAAPDENTLLALDHEDGGCSGADAETFLRTLEALTERRCVLYSGHLIKEQLKNQVNEYLGSCRLWLTQYGASPSVQASWNDWWLWQYTGDGKGPLPQRVPGIGLGKDPGAPIDVNSYQGDAEDLARQWSGKAPVIPVASAANITSWVQASLNIIGRKPLLVVDGRYGAKTKEAVSKYQMDMARTITGIPDPDTIASLLIDVASWNAQRKA